MRLPNPTPSYDQNNETRRNSLLEQADAQNRKRQQDVELGSGQRLILVSPNGNRWSIVVSNAGAITATAL